MPSLFVAEALSSNWTLVPITVLASGLWWKRYHHHHHQQKQKSVEPKIGVDISQSSTSNDDSPFLQTLSDLPSLQESTSTASTITKETLILVDECIEIEMEHEQQHQQQHNQRCIELVLTNENETEQFSTTEVFTEKKHDGKATPVLANEKHSSIFYRPKGRRYTKIMNILHRQSNCHEDSDNHSRPSSPGACEKLVVPSPSPPLSSKPSSRSRSTKSTSSWRSTSSWSTPSWTVARRLRRKIRRRTMDKRRRRSTTRNGRKSQEEDDCGSHTSVSS